MFWFELHLSYFSASFESLASFSSYSWDLRIIGLTATNDLRDTETELLENKALYKRITARLNDSLL